MFCILVKEIFNILALTEGDSSCGSIAADFDLKEVSDFAFISHLELIMEAFLHGCGMVEQ